MAILDKFFCSVKKTTWLTLQETLTSTFLNFQLFFLSTIVFWVSEKFVDVFPDVFNSVCLGVWFFFKTPVDIAEICRYERWNFTNKLGKRAKGVKFQGFALDNEYIKISRGTS